MAGENLNPKPTAFTGDYSRFSYDVSKGYVAVLKEQGVPLLDDELNSMQLSMLAQFRKLGSTFIGTGSPDNGFLISEHSPNVNDFTINAGTFIIDGWILNLAAATTYQAQPNAMPVLTTPGSSRTDTVYLDVWTNEINSTEDTGLVDPAIGSETSCRLKLMWAVRVAENSTTVPTDGLKTGDVYHWYVGLARLSRDANNTITAAEITDIRRKTYSATTVTDQFGTPPGAVMAFAMNSAPSGWLACDGSSRLISQFPALSAAIRSTYGYADDNHFYLPDLRGYFVRGYGTNGDGTQSGSFGAKQPDALKEHTHDIPYGAGLGNGLFPANAQSVTATGGVTGGAGTETRPRNIAMLYCIKT